MAKWVGVSPLSGKYIAFLHILVTTSSLKTTICWVQYCILAGLVRNSAVGTSSLSSFVRWVGSGGLKIYRVASYT